MKGKYIKQNTFSRISAVILSVVFILSFMSEISLPAFAVSTSSEQETVSDQTDGLEYQTIRSLPGEDETEIVTLDGLMPVNAEVNVQSSSEYTGDNLFAYNISITDKNGAEFQPVNEEPIKVEITNTAISVAQEANQKLRLWHIDDNGLREEIKNFTVTDNKIIFEASGFSVYEVDNGTSALRTYKFLMPSNPQDNSNYAAYYFPTSSQREDGSFKEICSQTIKNGENLIFPQLPADIDSKYTFVGWFIGSGGTPSNQQLDFNAIPAVTQNETVELYAVFESCVYAIFHEQYNGRTDTFPVFATRRSKLESIGTNNYEVTFENIDDLKVIYDDEEKEEGAPPSMQFVGWTTKQIKSYSTGETPDKLVNSPTFHISETENDGVVIQNSDGTTTPAEDRAIRLYPIFEPIRWLEFDSNGKGATYIPPKSFPKAAGTVIDNNVPVRAGYVFDGWYTAETGGVQVTDAQQHLISSVSTDELEVRDEKLYVKEPKINTKLYAHWTQDNSKYTVIIWKQKESDDRNATTKTYDYAESYTITENVKTEQIVSVDSTYTTKNYTGFYYASCDGEKEVAGNGSTVLNVYYDRCTVVYRFLNSGTSSTPLYEWTGLYGQKITMYGYHWDSTVRWYYKKNTNQVITYLDSFNSISDSDSDYNSSSHTYTTEIYKNGTNSSYQVIHVLQDLNGNYDLNNTDLVYYTNASSNNSSFTFTNKFEGFTVYGYSLSTFNSNPSNNASVGDSVSRQSTNLYVYHKRNIRTLKFVDSVDQSKTYGEFQVLYQASIETYRPADPTTPPAGYNGYQFTNWYSNDACSSNAVVDFSNTIMPNANMIIYAGWDTIWYKIEIDPNGGELSSTQSTFFWEPYNGDPIEEYRSVSRNYEADVNGTYYYAKHDRAYYGLGDTWESREDNISDRGAFYTKDSTQATSETRYREATGAYRYLGWYEVDPDTGAETPYYFGTPVMHDTYLRLHWKQLGTYYIKYDAGEGTIDSADQNEMTFEFLDAQDYADHADVVVTRVAKPVNGMNFVGWRMKNDPSGKVYYPGQSFEFSSAYAEAISEVDATTGAVEVKRTIIMQAVYEEIKTAEIIYDANGGTINDSANAILPANAGGQLTTNAPDPVNDSDFYEKISVKYGVTETQLTVSDLLNNSAVQLSNGTGFYNHGYVFLGWSPKKDGSEDFYDKASITASPPKYRVDNDAPTVLYAQWEVKVYFDRNDIRSPENTYYWGNGTGDGWASDSKYTYDTSKDMYYTTIKLNGKVDKPIYTPTSSDAEEMFSHWSLEKQNAAGVMNQAFNFDTTSITQALINDQHNDGDYLVLHACWRAPIRIPVYYVDTSNENRIRQDNWRKEGDGANIVLRDNSHVSLADKTDADSYAQTGKTDDYAYAFATESGKGDNDYKTITDNIKIKEIWYDSDEMCVKAKYSDNTVHEFDAANDAVYLVYYKSPDSIPVGYDLMTINGSLTPVNVNSAAPQTANVVLEPPYILPDHITQPIEWTKWGNQNNQKYQYYSFAVGKTNANSAADLKVITGYKTSDSDRPSLQVRNNWNGFEYSFDGENWHNCGYDIALYAVYYEQLPTIVNLKEETIALPDKMDTKFEYEITITQTESKTVTRKFSYYRNNKWRDLTDGNYRETVFDSTSETPVIPKITLELSSGDSDSYVLFFSSPADTTTERTEYKVNGVQQTYLYWGTNYPVYYQDTITHQTISQIITITQTQNSEFTTSNDADSGDQQFNSNYTSSANADPVTITYTNRQILEKEVNVAVSSGDKLIAHTDDLRTTNTNIYQHNFTSSAVWNVSDTAVISPADLINNNSDYIFIGIITGTKQYDEITQEQTDITSLNFGEITQDVYGYYLNGDTAMLLDNQEIYFVYVKKPTIRYWYEKPDGSFEEISEFKRNGETFTRPGTGIAQNEVLPVSTDGLLISQISTPGAPAFLIPGDLDYQNDKLRLDLNRLSIGDSAGIITNSDSESMQITVTDGKLQYRFHDSDTPKSFSETDVVYAVYKIKGYELTLTKQVLGDAMGNNTFTFEISSDQLTYSKYDTSKGQVTASGNTITLSVHRGESVTVYGLLSGTYTITETTDGNYEMTAKVNGTDAKVTGNKVAASIADNTSVEVLNTYPIPVTGAGEQAAPYIVVIMIVSASMLVFIRRRKGEKQNECSSL